MRKISFALVLAFIACMNIQATPKQKYSQQDVLSPEVAETILGKRVLLKESYAYKSDSLLACLYNSGTKRQPQDALLLWRQSSNGFELIHKREALAGETFEKPVVFMADNLRFLNLSTEPNGSGGFVNDTILWLAPDGSVHEVEFQQASEVYEGLAEADEVVMTGGEKEFFLQDEQMKFLFWIARQGDPHCCPSGGLISGTYRVQGTPKYDSFTRRYSADFKILVDNMQHLPNDYAETGLASAD